MPANMGFLGVGARIANKEGPLALYKGLGAVVSGIVPKMAIRFSSFEAYKGDPYIKPYVKQLIIKVSWKTRLEMSHLDRHSLLDLVPALPRQ